MFAKLSLLGSIIGIACVSYAKWLGLFDYEPENTPAPSINHFDSDFAFAAQFLMAAYWALGTGLLTGIISTLKLGRQKFKYSGLILSLLASGYLASEILY